MPPDFVEPSRSIDGRLGESREGGGRGEGVGGQRERGRERERKGERERERECAGANNFLVL